MFLLAAGALGVWGAASVRPDPDGPPRVGVQAGHWRAAELPDELAVFRTSTGASAGGVDEVDLNLGIARRVAALLRRRGVIVDVLPATVPPDYKADAFVSLHADGSRSSRPRGYKIATPYRESDGSRRLRDALVADYGRATRLPWDPNITPNMRGYYAFDNRSREHEIDGDTPAVIVEMGFVSNPDDRALLTRKPDLVARAIAGGILHYLQDEGRLPPSRPTATVSPLGREAHGEAPAPRYVQARRGGGGRRQHAERVRREREHLGHLLDQLPVRVDGQLRLRPDAHPGRPEAVQ